ncbi:MAG: glycosyltransferase family 2 protein [Rikenellaceae bacterium]|nr:glycosyltransferase family 2 protein [Rikenellaceae bacterium]
MLVPARNEAENLQRLLSNVGEWAGEIHELIVYDDLSTDRTFSIACGFSRTEPKMRVLRGRDLPAGWLGKNHACHLLAQEATGERLLFIDADVRLQPGAVGRAVEQLDRHGLQLLSIFPQQIIDSAGSRLTVPLMNWILLSLLPLAAVRSAPQASLSAANGQFMLFNGEVYRREKPHQRFRASAVEDIAISRFYKKQGHKISTLLGKNDIECRMYSTLREAIAGFSKNLFDFFGGKVWLCFLFLIVVTVAPFWIFSCNGWVPGLLYVGAAAGIRISVSITSRQDAVRNVILSIPQIFFLWVIALRILFRRKSLVWKERKLEGL